LRVAVIPARGGSKRIPRKNIKEFCGKPMIAWSIETARDSGVFDRIIVSTDDEEIAHVAVQCGAETPFRRPAALSDDYADTVEVVAHATQWLLDHGCSISAVCCIYATAAFLQKNDLARGLQVLENGDWAYVFSATDYASSIFRAFRNFDAGGIEMFFPEHYDKRSQDLPRAFHDAAQFYWGRPESWIDRRWLFDRHSSVVTVPRWRVQDIDTEDDWDRAELMFQLIKQRRYAHDKSC
jgi:N-acylneuraminate cytidylyltransferase